MIIYFFVIEPQFFNKAKPGDVFDNRMNLEKIQKVV